MVVKWNILFGTLEDVQTKQFQFENITNRTKKERKTETDSSVCASHQDKRFIFQSEQSPLHGLAIRLVRFAAQPKIFSMHKTRHSNQARTTFYYSSKASFSERKRPPHSSSSSSAFSFTLLLRRENKSVALPTPSKQDQLFFCLFIILIRNNIFLAASIIIFAVVACYQLYQDPSSQGLLRYKQTDIQQAFAALPPTTNVNFLEMWPD